MYTSLLISLLAAFIAVLGKWRLDRYLRNSGGSMIERCGDRQRKCDGLEKWPLDLFIESPGDAPAGASPAYLRTLLVHVVCQHLGRVHVHRSHLPWGHGFHRDRDRRDFFVCVSFPNTCIYRSAWSMEEGPTWSFLLW